MEGFMMAQRLDLCERVRFEVLLRQGLTNAEIAECLGKSRATVWREKKRCVQGAYCAQTAQNKANMKALRPRLDKLAADTGLAEQVADRLGERLSPHAISAELAELGYRICGETIYQACCYVSTSSGLPPNSWALLPRARRRCKPLSRCSQAKRSVLDDWRRRCDRRSEVDNRQEPGH